MKRLMIVVAIGVFLMPALLSGAVPGWENVPRITKEDLKPLIGNPDVVILDVRQPGDWDASDRKIKGAVRVDPKEKLGAVMDKIPKDKKLVFYCS